MNATKAQTPTIDDDLRAIARLEAAAAPDIDCAMKAIEANDAGELARVLAIDTDAAERLMRTALATRPMLAAA